MAEPSRLSEAAVAVLRFEIKGYVARDKARRLPAYRELAAAGIMEPVPDTESDYRFTEFGLARREEILAREEERIARERLDPPDTDLSEAARERLRLHLEGDRKVTEENHPAYRELVAARVMIHSRPFVGGDAYGLTYWGWKLRDELTGLREGNRVVLCTDGCGVPEVESPHTCCLLKDGWEPHRPSGQETR